MNLVMLNWFITKWGSIYYKLRHVLQSEATLLPSGAGITKWAGMFPKVDINITSYLDFLDTCGLWVPLSNDSYILRACFIWIGANNSKF